MSDEPDIVDINESGDIHHLSSSGVSQGLDMGYFHHIYRSTGKPAKMGPIAVLGGRNYAFRSSEANSMDCDLAPCTGSSCPHCETLKG